jgi:adenosylhomocysteine nucleosidase
MTLREQAPIAVLFALQAEAAPFRRLGRGLEQVRVRVTGLGQANARRSIQAVLRDDRPSMVLSSGLAGALDPTWRHNDVLIEAEEGFPLLRLFLDAGARPGRFHCSATIVVSVAEKARLRARTGAGAVEMESQPIREACRAAGVPSATIRVISDVAGEDLPLDFNRFLKPSGKLHYLRLGGAALRSWRTIQGLLRLQRQTASAAQALADVLVRALRTLGT